MQGRGPSSSNGVVGLKTTLGLVSRDGIIPLSLSFDTAGPMARNVYDVAVALGVMAGGDEADATTTANEGRAPVRCPEFKPQIEAYLATLGPSYPKTLDALIARSRRFTATRPDGAITGYAFEELTKARRRPRHTPALQGESLTVP